MYLECINVFYISVDVKKKNRILKNDPLGCEDFITGQESFSNLTSFPVHWQETQKLCSIYEVSKSRRYSHTVSTFNSYTKCTDILHAVTPDYQPVSWTWMT